MDDKQHNGFSEFVSKVILSRATDLGESLIFLEKRCKITILKPTIQPSKILSSIKGIVSVTKC